MLAGLEANVWIEAKVSDAAACMNERSANKAVSNVRFIVLEVHDP